jgi:hypothetical protein
VEFTDDLKAFSALATELSPVSNQPKQSKRSKRSFKAVLEDFVCCAPSHDGGAGDSCAVFEVLRATFDAVVTIPLPPLQQFAVSADHLRLLFAKNSGMYSADSEHSFLEVNFVSVFYFYGLHHVSH